MNDSKVLYAASFGVAASLAALGVLSWQHSEGRPPYPPGPKGYPLIGSVLDVPQDVPIWQVFGSIARQHNTDVLYMKMLSKELVVLNSSEAIRDLCERRSAIYSDRPTIPMLELMGIYSWNIPSLWYGNKWKKGRRLFHEFFNVNAVTNFDDYQRKHARRFISRLSQSPEDFFDHAQFVTGALIMEITYGMDVKSHEDKFLQAAEHATEYGERVMVPGAFLVDTFPILKNVPEWFPGAGFRRFASEAREMFNIAVDGPLEWVKETLKSNGSNASVASSCFDRVVELQSQGFDESDIRMMTASTYIAATDTTLAVLKSFFLVMALHPHVVRKAQEELDRVVGNERLPELSDRENLPYISALLKELLRWACPLPFGIPKRTMQDDVYEGYFIPAGVTIIENIWTICYNEAIYPKPGTYDPGRFLKDGKLDGSVAGPEGVVFGSGRRICPGRHFALRTLFLNIACILAVFDISAPVGEKLEAKYKESSIRHPLPFKCVIKPRSDASLKLARDSGAVVDSS